VDPKDAGKSCFGSPFGESTPRKEKLALHLLRAQDLNYHLDDVKLPSVDEDRIDTLEWPSLNIATVPPEA
jgi:hypothetical protein